MKTQLKILIAEHDPVDLELMHTELEKTGITYLSQVVQNEQDYVNALKIFLPDIILCDFTFPSFDGETAFKIREAIAPNIPFIVVSGTIGEERSIELIKSGVTDYCLKDKLYALNHKVLRALKDSTDKRQKIQAAQGLAESEKQLAKAQQVAHMGNWELNFSTNNLRWSDETFRIHGLHPTQNSQSLGYMLSFVHAKDVANVSEKIKNSHDSLSEFSITYRIVQNNGSIRHVYLNSKPEFDLKGKVTGLYGILQDVTEIVLLEKKLAKERMERQKETTGAVLSALETERENIGYELHENLNQMLSVAKLYIQSSEQQVEKRQIYLGMSCDIIAEVMMKIRKLSNILKIPKTHIANLVDNIKNLVHDLSLTHSLKIKFYNNSIEVGLLNEKLQMTIFRIVQEQMNNITTHSNATLAEINLSQRKNKIILFISDNGDGCDILKENSGVGLMNIRTRADLYDGEVVVVSTPGKGFDLKVELFTSGFKSKEKELKKVRA